MTQITRRAVLAGATALTALPARAENAPGVTDKEILFGQTMPYSGPASSYGTIGKSADAYFHMINDKGGINGRMLRMLSLDDGYLPPKTVELTRRMIEEDKVAFLFNCLGTPTNNATRKYTNSKKVPDIFVATGATQFGDREHYPWTMGWQPTYQVEGRIYAHYILQAFPDAKVAVLYQGDDSGRDYFKGIKDGLGDKADKMIVATATYEVSDPTVDSQILTLRDAGADVLFMTGIPKFNAMGIRKAFDVGWKPRLFCISSTGSSVATAIVPAGVEKAVGVVTASYLKDPTDKQWATDPGFVEWRAFLEKYYPGADPTDVNNAYGYTTAQTLVQTLTQCGNDLSRENIMRQATSLDIALPMLQPGIRVKTGPEDYYPLKQMRLVRFDGTAWIPFGEAISG
ncbi:MAG TPA: branched-chain amino acid ABC transporter substrate-binding protein [Acetobacteraceae bacterium]|jgi:branched-chain amino acid transport system substrate-binding protein|nr:branched-chain amino acid ABC transporter substrate-binding protein [Acetobacteraceae bacterium]